MLRPVPRKRTASGGTADGRTGGREAERESWIYTKNIRREVAPAQRFAQKSTRTTYNTVSSSGRYRLLLQFRDHGEDPVVMEVVVLAVFAVVVVMLPLEQSVLRISAGSAARRATVGKHLSFCSGIQRQKNYSDHSGDSGGWVATVVAPAGRTCAIHRRREYTPQGWACRDAG